jgi:hypothetical protein
MQDSAYLSQNMSRKSEILRQTFATQKTLENQGNSFLSHNLQLLRHEAWQRCGRLDERNGPW